MSAAAGRWVAIDRALGDPHNVATVVDIEAHADTIGAARSKLITWNEQRRPFPTAYHDRASWGQVNTDLQGISYSHWVATLDGTLVPDGYYMAAVQFAGEKTLGFHADMSVVWADNWHPIPVHASPVPVAAIKADLAAVQTALSHLASGIAAL